MEDTKKTVEEQENTEDLESTVKVFVMNDDTDSEDEIEDTEDVEENEKKEGFFKKRKKPDVKALETELEKKEAEVAELKDKYQRLMAEFENARKRNAKETTKMFDIGAKSVLEKLLPVIDNFERGLNAVSEEEKETAFVQGVDAIYKQLMTVFGEIGVSPIEALDKEFNADFHNAVMHVEDEAYGDNVVVEELQKGYMYKEEVLRYSMVKVAN